MKNIFLLFPIFALIFILSCNNPAANTTSTTDTPPITPPKQEASPSPSVDEGYTFEQGRVGKAKIGMDKQTFFALYPTAKEGTAPSEGIELLVWEVKDTDGKSLFEAIVEENRITGFFTSNPRMQNAEKIHPGSSYTELTAAYKELKFANSEGLTVSPKGYDYFNMRISGVQTDYNEETGAITKVVKAEQDAQVGEFWIFR